MEVKLMQSRRYNHIKSGKRPDLDNQFFRSKMEANFARYLKLLKRCGNIHDWKYEADTFEFHKIKRGTRFYLPDFKVWDTPDSEPYYYEVKGFMDAKSKTKLKRMAKYYPEVKVIIIDDKAYRQIAKHKHLIAGWE
jgi:hypothetical protein